MPKIPLSQLFPRASVLALDLLERLLKFDPAQRININDALAHPYLAAYHDVEDEPQHLQLFDFTFESVQETEEMRKLIAKEIMEFKASKAEIPQPLLSPCLPNLVSSASHRHQPSNASSTSSKTAASHHHSTSSISSMSSAQTLINQHIMHSMKPPVTDKQPLPSDGIVEVPVVPSQSWADPTVLQH